MKNVLITGADSYIGTSFEKYALEHYADEIKTDTIDMMDDGWKKYNFGKYDIVYHVAGIAHADVGRITEEIKSEYYRVNRDLAIDVARKSKEEGVKHFVFMSSAIIYGDPASYGKERRITKETEPCPASFYGDAKWQADKGVRELAGENFIVSVLRPPMMYGKGSRGNYAVLSRLSRNLPVFPDVKNERSMLYIDNFCEFLCQVIIRSEGGVFWPQNAEYTRTSEMVKTIADVNHHKIWVSKVWNPIIIIASMFPGKIGRLTNKAFGNITYDQSISQCDFDYQKVTLEESIKRTEG